jgi:methyl-accepting chemotaxis protein
MTRATRNAAAGGMVGRPGWPGTGTRHLSFLLLLFPLFAITGCKDDTAQQQEVADARAKVQAMRLNLERLNKEIADLRAERDAIRQNRDELQETVAQLIQERDQAALSAQQSQATIKDLTTRTSGQMSATAALEKQIAQLKAQVEEQQKTIEQLKAAAAQPATVEPATVEPAEGTAEPQPVEPNQGE